MSFHADLHIHSKYSRACSRDCDLEHLAWWAGRKGVAVVGTGDFTHPAWLAELESQLVPAEPGLFRLRDDTERAVLDRLPPTCRSAARFMLSVEISTIYKRGERTRKVHHLVYAPDFETVRRFNATLGRIGNLTSDGRPILGLDSRDLLEITLESGPGAYLVPAHVWTPWFAVLGSMSGFDAVEDCYADLADHIFAVETGLSSDPAMNRRVSGLDRYRLVSNSDAHSPPILGREATTFDTAADYHAIRRALETGEGLDGTIEFFPEEGKYHLDGHRKCEVRLEPEDTRRRDGSCPGCGKPVTVGVLHRVEALADRADGQGPPGAAPFRCLVPLPEVMGELLGVGARSKTVDRAVSSLVSRLGPELDILTRVPVEAICDQGSAVLAEAITRLRAGRVIREAGYDGEYGVIRLFSDEELRGPALISLFPSEPAAVPAPPASALPVPAPVVVAGPVHGLDYEQQAAAAAPGPLLVVAGPGTGKTRTLTHRLAGLAERGVPPSSCLAVTFTRRAAAELQERLNALLPGGAPGPTVTTFHGLGLRLVQEQHEALDLPQDVRVVDEGERQALLVSALGLLAAPPRRLLDELSTARRTGQARPEVEDYLQTLHARGLVDLDDLLALPVALFDADPELALPYRDRWPHVCVDEYQDVDDLQYRLLRHLVAPDGDLCAIGDPDQAIYGFRGGDVGFFLRFAQDFTGARSVTLTRNYRSTSVIVDAACQAVAPQSLVPGRLLRAAVVDVDTPPIVVAEHLGERGEADFVVRAIEDLLGGSSHYAIDSGWADGTGDGGLGFGDFAVLARTDAQLDPFAEALGRAGMPFQRRTHDRLTDRPGVSELVARLCTEPGLPRTPLTEALRAAARSLTPLESTDLEALVDLLDPLAQRCGTDLERFRAELALGAQVDTWDPRADRMSLLTLHAAKGLEFPVVFVAGCEDGLLPLRRGSDVDVAEERRLFFVGMTRARSRLFLTSARRRLRHGTVRETTPSPFLAAIQPSLLERRAPSAPRSAARPREHTADQLQLL